MMKKGLFLSCFVFCLLLSSFAVNAQQIKTPAPSPKATMTTTIGLTDVEIEYSRPSKKGRDIFSADGLVPFGKIWRTGANASTKISFSNDVMIGGKELKKGKYALYVTPNASEWEIVFYKDIKHWGVPQEWKAEDEALRFKAKTLTFPKEMAVETFTILVGNSKVNAADIEMMWDQTFVAFTVETDVDTKVMADIDRAMAGTSRGDYYSAARYFYDNGKDLNKAHKWISKANEIDAKFWQLRLQSLIEADMGKKKMAIATAQKSMDMAQKAGNMDYVRMNEKSIVEWGGKAIKAVGGSR